MKRILYLSRGGQIAGSQRQLYYLLSNLTDAFSPVIFFNRGGDFSEQVSERGVLHSSYNLPPWRKFPKGFSRYFYVELLVQQARKNDVALVHCNNLCLSGYMRWIARRLGIPSVLHVRMPLSTADIYKHGCDKATALIAISRRVRRNLLEAKISPQKIVRINDSVDLKAFCPMGHAPNSLRQRYKINNSIVIGLVGRIEPSKKQLEFLQVAESIVKKTKGRLKIWFVGPIRNSDYCDQVQQFIHDRNLQGHVLLMGQCEDMPEVLNAVDILVTLSGGSVMFEAAACGKPVVAMYPGNSAPQTLKYITSRPILLAQSQTELTETLLRLIKDPAAREDIGYRSRRWAQRSFDPCVMTSKTQKLYEKLLPQGKCK